jgi:hypothetical protein
MSTIAVNAITDASGGNTASINGATPTTDNTMGRNRIQNGDMRIDQRNAGASVTAGAATYTLDRWIAYDSSDAVFTVQQDSSAPAGFVNSAKITITTADASIAASQYNYFAQRIEGFNVADLNWGSANAKTVTLSFWVRSSVTGTFGGALANSAYNRSYPFTYAISVADTWEKKSVTISGDTSGTWLTTNGIGIQVLFDLGTGTDNTGTAGAWVGAGNIGADSTIQLANTLNATWYITGVQLEVGSVATSFERRSYGQELALCQRYYFDAKLNLSSPQKIIWGAPILSTTSGSLRTNVYYPVTMRADPTITVAGSSTGTFISGAPYANYPTPENAHIILDTTAAGNYAYIYSFIASAEL